jgi:Ca2+-binding RTX toxin-like protein
VFTRGDGSSGSTVEMESLAANLDLLSNTFYSQYPDTITLTTSAAALPNVGGSGRVRSLREAASLSSALDAVATDYAQQTTRSAQISRLDNLMTSWAATSDLGSLQQQFARVNAQGNPATLTYSLAGYTVGTPQYAEMLRRIGVVESFMGFNYLGSGVSSAVLSAGTGNMTVTLAAPQLQAISEAYDIFKGDVYSALLFDTRLKPYVQAIQYQTTSDDVVADFSQVETLFNQAIATDATAGVVDLIEFVSAFGAGSLQALGWQPLPYLVSKLPQAPAVAGLVEKLAGDLTLIVAADNQSLVQATGHSNVLIASHADTTLYGLGGDDVLVGQEGNDVLEGGKGNNVFYGGAGNDYMYGQEGSNTYVYVAGEGSDVIRNEEGDVGNVDVVRIKGVDPSQTSYVRQGGSLVFSFAGKAQTLTVTYFFSGSGEDVQGLDSFVFDDGTVLSTEEIYDKVLLGTANADYLAGFSRDDVINGQAGDDIILGKGGDDQLDGGDGDDQLYGGDGDDVLRGGAGNDYLEAGTGANTYIFGRGDGQDMIASNVVNGYDQSADTLVMDDVSTDDLIFEHVGYSLVIRIAGTADQITLANYFVEGGINKPIGTIVAGADDYTYSFQEIRGLVTTGNARDNNITGFDADEVIDGMAGNDVIDGAGGNDILEGGEGDDQLTGGTGNDQLHGGAGNDLMMGGERQ